MSDVTLIRNEDGYDVFLGTRLIGTVDRSQETYMQDRHRSSPRLTHAWRWYARPMSLDVRVYGSFSTRRRAVEELVEAMAAAADRMGEALG